MSTRNGQAPKHRDSLRFLDRYSFRLRGKTVGPQYRRTTPAHAAAPHGFELGAL